MLHVGNWWNNGNTSLRWYEWENITIYVNFNADFYETGSPIEDNVSWGHLNFEIIKVGNSTPIIQGQFIAVDDGVYQATINLSMQIQSITSENYQIIMLGMAQDIQNASLSINLNVIAKKDIIMTEKFNLKSAKATGRGMGKGGPRQRTFGTDYCYCPSCGKKVKHVRGVPCADKKCTDCDVALTGVKPKSKKK